MTNHCPADFNIQHSSSMSVESEFDSGMFDFWSDEGSALVNMSATMFSVGQ